jgi:beta-lactamase class A
MKNLEKYKQLLTAKIPVYVVILYVAVVFGIFYFFHNTEAFHLGPAVAVASIPAGNCITELVRENGFDLLKPLLLTNNHCTVDPLLKSIKKSIISFIDQQKSMDKLTTATVYLRRLDNGGSISVNDDETYSPGSLMKVVTLIAYLKEAEQNPEILTKKIFYNKNFHKVPIQTIIGPQLIPGQNYSIQDLLYYMIVYSDNVAAALLASNIRFATMQKLFTDLRLPVPVVTQRDYPIHASEYSRFFRILYNGTYLNQSMSEYALDLLTKSTYKDGITKSLSDNITVAHKFGERIDNSEVEVHEFAIVYLKNDTYLLGIMTKGKDHAVLSENINNLSKMVYDSMKGSIFKNMSANTFNAKLVGN